MARNTQLIDLVQMVREECEKSSSLAVGVDDLPGIKTKLRRTQDVLYADWDWPHLKKRFTPITLQAGERYYDPPEDLNFDRIAEDGVRVWYSGIAHPISRGITLDDFNSYNSDDGDRAEPVLKWDVVEADGETREQIEVWPIPSTNNQTLQFEGIRNLRDLVANGDRADLDDQMLVLFVAAEILGKKDKGAAAVLGSAAQSLRARLQGRSRNNTKRYVMGGAPAEMEKREIVVRVGT